LALAGLSLGTAALIAPSLYLIARMAFSGAARDNEESAQDNNINSALGDIPGPIQQDLLDTENDLQEAQARLKSLNKNSKEFAEVQNQIKNDDVAIILFQKALDLKP